MSRPAFSILTGLQKETARLYVDSSERSSFHRFRETVFRRRGKVTAPSFAAKIETLQLQ
jgi:hypothetical protein